MTPPAKGTLVITDAATGAFTYTPNAGAIGYDTFTFRATDGSAASSTATGMVFIVAASPQWPGQTVRASVSSAGVQGNALSGTLYPPALSADGRYVAFQSTASNLVAGDTNGAWDVFVLDRTSGAVTRASVSSGGAQGNSDSSDGLSISADGRFVAFSSGASNLVSGDTNGAEDIFVYDRQTGTTTRASVATDGTQANSQSFAPALSADGRYVAFVSLATNLVAGDTNGVEDVFVHDLQTGQTIRASVASGGTQADGFALEPSISADGRFVAFMSNASNFDGGGNNGARNVFVHDFLTGATVRASVATDGTPGNDFSIQPALSADGRYVAFYSLATNLVPGDTNGVEDVFVRDMQTGLTTRVSVASDGTQGNGASFSPSFSADGRYVAFQSAATNLVSGDTNGTADVFVRDLQTALTMRVSVGNDGTQANALSQLPGFSADGRYVGFSSGASNLVLSDTNNQFDVFVTGGVTVSPTSVSVPSAGGTRSVTVTFDYPGTPWSATTTTPWITINPPNGGSASGTLNFTVAANSARRGRAR